MARAGLAQGLLQGGSQGVVSDCVIQKSSLKLERFLPKWVMYTPGKLVLVISRRPQFLAIWVSSVSTWVSLPHVSWLAPVRAIQERISGKL